MRCTDAGRYFTPLLMTIIVTSVTPIVLMIPFTFTCLSLSV